MGSPTPEHPGVSQGFPRCFDKLLPICTGNAAEVLEPVHSGSAVAFERTFPRAKGRMTLVWATTTHAVSAGTVLGMITVASISVSLTTFTCENETAPVLSVTYAATVVQAGVSSPKKPLPVIVTLILSPANHWLEVTEVMVGGEVQITWPWQSEVEAMKKMKTIARRAVKSFLPL